MTVDELILKLMRESEKGRGDVEVMIDMTPTNPSHKWHFSNGPWGPAASPGVVPAAGEPEPHKPNKEQP